MKKAFVIAACLLLILLAACGADGAADEIILSVSGDGVSTPAEFSLKELQALDDQNLTYSTLNNYPSVKYACAEGCSLAVLLEACGLEDEATLITVSANDGFSKTFLRDQLLGDAYFYDLGGNPTAVEPVLAWAYSDDGSKIPQTAEDEDDLRLVLGQQGPHDPNASVSVREVSSIEVSCAPATQLAPCSFQKTEDGLVELVYENMDVVKLYYTLDGSDPDPLTSEVYNPSTSNFQPELNAPLDLSPGTVVRAKAVAVGYIDSEISEYVVE